jgi:ferredoxin
MKITIDRDGCIECGNCAATCGEVFELKPGDKSDIKPKYRAGGPDKGEAGDNLSKCVNDAADGCPVAVINVEK